MAKTRTQPFSIRVSPEALKAYKKAAEAAGLSQSEWARLELDVSAGFSQIRHVYYIDVGSMEPEEAINHVRAVGKKVRDGKW